MEDDDLTKIKKKEEYKDIGIETCLLESNDQSIYEDIICQICLNIVISPLHCKDCGKPYCSYCIANWMKKSNSCPNCRNKNIEELPRILINFLNRIKLKCKFNPNCKEIIVYSEFLNHVKKCEFGEFLCFGEECETSGTLDQIKLHIKNCDKIKIKCIYCSFLISKKFENSHYDICNKKQEYFEKKILELQDENNRLTNQIKELNLKNNNDSVPSKENTKEIKVIEIDENITKNKLDLIIKLLKETFEHGNSLEKIQSELNYSFGSCWTIVKYKEGEGNCISSKFHNEYLKVLYCGFIYEIFRSVKLLDGNITNHDSLNIISQSKGLKKEMWTEIFNLVKEARLKFPNVLKDRSEFLLKQIQEKFGESWVVMIGGHLSKTINYCLDQYIEFYFEGLIYVIFRSFPEEDLTDNEVNIIEKTDFFDNNVLKFTCNEIKKIASEFPKSLYSRCEKLSKIFNEKFGNYWSVNALIKGFMFYNFYKNQLFIAKYQGIQYVIYRSSMK